jgi:hypothetical protein
MKVFKERNRTTFLKTLIISVVIFASCKEDLMTDIDKIYNKLEDTKTSDFFVVTADSLLLFNGGAPPHEFYVYTDKFIDSRPDEDIVLIEFRKGSVTIKQFYFKNMSFEKISVGKYRFLYSDTIKLEFIESFHSNFLEIK